MPEIIDGHTHIGLGHFLAKPIPEAKLTRPAFQDQMENSIASLISAMDANGVGRAVTFGYPLEEIDRVRANNYVLEAYRAFPNRIIPFALVGDDVEYWLKQGTMGFKQQNILYAPERFDLPRAYQIMAEAGVPMLIHFRAGNTYHVTEQVEAILANVPALTLIVAHMGRNTPNTADQVDQALIGLRDYPNVIFETSTVRAPQIVELAVEIVGEDRIIFGSDYPFNSYLDADPLAVEIGIIEQANISSEAKAKILAQNCQTLFNLQPAA